MRTPEQFLRDHDMFYEQMPFEDLIGRYLEEMEAGLNGRPSSLYMIPSYIRADSEPARGQSVLVIDAGGTNLRVGRVHFDSKSQSVVETLKKRYMPGAGGEHITADEMFRRIAEFALEAAEGCSRACVSFSYPCQNRPDGDGMILELGKELQVEGAEGRLVCASLEAALKELGAAGSRSWRLTNDSVGSLLGGKAAAPRGRFRDFIGFILGTGTNMCCAVPSASITKDPEAAAMGGEMIVNLESGCFDKLLLGTVDRELDAESEIPGDHLAEKMISGSYYRQVLERTLLLAAREGELSPETGEKLRALRITSALVDSFCLDPHGNNALSQAFLGEQERTFAAGVNMALLERAARVAAAGLAAVIRFRALPRGSRVCVSADGTMLRLNPVLRPAMERYLAEYALEGMGVETEFLFASDATLMGSAWAGLI